MGARIVSTDRLPVSGRLLGCLLPLLMACGGPPTRVCPSPIGVIALDACDRTLARHEQLAHRLSAAEQTMPSESGVLPASGERLLALAQQLDGLCRSFNACSLAPDHYRRRRGELRGQIAKIAAIGKRLAVEPAARTRTQLERTLERLSAKDPDEPDSREPPRRAYKAWWPWFGTAFRPPQPPAETGFPRLAGVDFDLELVTRPEAPFGTIGYLPRLNAFLWGNTEPDDVLVVSWGKGRTSCPIGVQIRDDVLRIRCEAPPTQVFTADEIQVTLDYRRGADDRQHRLGTAATGVLVRPMGLETDPSKRWGINLDRRMGLASLIFRPSPGVFPARFERPHLVLVLKLHQYVPATAQCFINDAPVTAPLPAGRYTAREGWIRDTPASGRAYIEWWRYDFPLPFVARGREPPAAPDSSGAAAWPRAGVWRCVVSAGAEPLVAASFTVLDSGRLVPHPEQLRAHRAAWLIDLEYLSSGHAHLIEPSGSIPTAQGDPAGL